MLLTNLTCQKLRHPLLLVMGRWVQPTGWADLASLALGRESVITCHSATYTYTDAKFTIGGPKLISTAGLPSGVFSLFPVRLKDDLRQRENKVGKLMSRKKTLL